MFSGSIKAGKSQVPLPYDSFTKSMSMSNPFHYFQSPSVFVLVLSKKLS